MVFNPSYFNIEASRPLCWDFRYLLQRIKHVFNETHNLLLILFKKRYYQFLLNIIKSMLPCISNEIRNSKGVDGMTTQTSMLHVRIDDETKVQAQQALKAMGMSVSDAVRIF